MIGLQVVGRWGIAYPYDEMTVLAGLGGDVGYGAVGSKGGLGLLPNGLDFA